MTRIAILSDTHGYIDDKLFYYLESCDEVWHAGDIGDLDIVDRLKAKIKSRIVYGNIDNHILRVSVPEVLVFNCESVKVLIIHIAGKMGSYSPEVRKLIAEHKPGILVCGHSHILRVGFDKKHQLLYINPGAYGVHGFHSVRTLIRFIIDGKDIKNMEVIEIPRNTNLTL